MISYPGEVMRIRARFETPGQFVWHCHIVEHEDKEMMRPFFFRTGTPPRLTPNMFRHGPFVGAEDFFRLNVNPVGLAFVKIS